MNSTFGFWVFIALFMGTLMSFSVVGELNATSLEHKTFKDDFIEPPVSQKDKTKCKANKPFWDGEKCVQCIYTLDCTGNRICDKNKCLCPGKQTFDASIGDCACDAKKYPTGKHVNPIKCACEKGYQKTEKQGGGYECLTPAEIKARKEQQEQAAKEALGSQLAVSNDMSADVTPQMSELAQKPSK